jgi:hypothetical protein
VLARGSSVRSFLFVWLAFRHFLVEGEPTIYVFSFAVSLLSVGTKLSSSDNSVRADVTRVTCAFSFVNVRQCHALRIMLVAACFLC